MKKSISRILIALLCMVFLLALSSSAFASVSITPASGYAIATTAVNVRSGPSASDSIIGVLQQGAFATATGIVNNGWLQISYNGVYGYVNAVYMNIGNVTTTGAVTPVVPVITANPVVPVITASPVYGGETWYVNASALNVRSGAGSRYSVIGVVRMGQAVTKTGQQGNWTMISYNGGNGYVYTKYITRGNVNPVTPIVTASPVTPNAAGYVYTTSQVNLRNGPGTNYSVIGYANANSVLKVLGTSGDWVRVAVSNGGNYVAYVSSSYAIPYLYADASSRVTYPTCYGGSYSNWGDYNNWGWGGSWNSGCGNNYGYYTYYCSRCSYYLNSSVCPRCGNYTTRVNSNCNSNCNKNCTWCAGTSSCGSVNCYR